MIVSFVLVICSSPIAIATSNPELLASQLKYQTGTIALQGGVANVTVPNDLKYLKLPTNPNRIREALGNPHGDGTLGMIVPGNFNPLSKQSWGVVITYNKDGHVKDDDAESINYNDLLKTMQDGLKERNQERVKQGYAAIELVGWAKQPFYDKATKKLYWAKDLKFSDSGEHTLNYNIRVLGREGVLVLNAVAGIDQLGLIEKASPQVISSVSFNKGYRYEDFDPSSDKVAAYGVAALIAGVLLQKPDF